MLVFLSGMIGVAVGGKDVDVYVAVGAEVEATTMPVGVRGSVIGVYVAGAADLHPAAIVHIKSAHLKSSHLVEISDIKNSKIGYE